MTRFKHLLVHLWSMEADVAIKRRVVLETHAMAVHALVYWRARVLQSSMAGQLNICESLLRVVECWLVVLRGHVLIHVECGRLYTGVL